MTPNSRPDEAQALLAAAARDRLALNILARDAQAPVEIALFLAQQALEKAIKAVLALHDVVYRRTHDLLLLEALARDAGWCFRWRTTCWPGWALTRRSFATRRPPRHR